MKEKEMRELLKKASEQDAKGPVRARTLDEDISRLSTCTMSFPKGWRKSQKSLVKE